MRKRYISAFLVVTLLIGGVVAKDLLTGGASVPPPTLAEKNVLLLINVQRVKYGLPKLVYDSNLAVIARQHTNDMIKRNYFDHRNFEQRLASIHKEERAENIVWGSGNYGTAAGMVNSWMHSPPHRAIILTRQLTRTGVGVSKAKGNYQGYPGAVVATEDFSTSH